MPCSEDFTFPEASCLCSEDLAFGSLHAMLGGLSFRGLHAMFGRLSPEAFIPYAELVDAFDGVRVDSCDVAS